MPILFSIEIIQLVIYFAVLAIITATAIYVVGLLHEKSVQKELNTEDHLNNFRELKSQGKLSDVEFRIIKKQLAFQIVEEEKNKTQKPFDPAVLFSKGMGKIQNNDPVVFSENSDETQIAGQCNSAENDDTVLNQ
ncbi:MAG: hypothetical protein LBQ50_04985 [Planctomycetaceae bacterium]|jgi:hypothetical protein|nr:hypothetical protein [Planctomycetaceae bacterium]